MTSPSSPRCAPLLATSPSLFQLLHGDFNNENLRQAGADVRVFDFDDCGFGPRSFEVANALYMVLFASLTGDEPARYRPFEEAFLSGYDAESEEELERAVVNGFIELRVRALEAWLDDLTRAPIGIRTATPQWHNELRMFVSRYNARHD